MKKNKNDFIKDLLGGYLERRENDIKTFFEALKKNDMDSISSTAHKIKGNGTSFGFPELTEIAGGIEKFSLENDVVNLNLKIMEYEFEVKKIRANHAK